MEDRATIEGKEAFGNDCTMVESKGHVVWMEKS